MCLSHREKDLASVGRLMYALRREFICFMVASSNSAWSGKFLNIFVFEGDSIGELLNWSFSSPQWRYCNGPRLPYELGSFFFFSIFLMRCESQGALLLVHQWSLLEMDLWSAVYSQVALASQVLFKNYAGKQFFPSLSVVAKQYGILDD